MGYGTNNSYGGGNYSPSMGNPMLQNAYPTQPYSAPSYTTPYTTQPYAMPQTPATQGVQYANPSYAPVPSFGPVPTGQQLGSLNGAAAAPVGVGNNGISSVGSYGGPSAMPNPNQNAQNTQGLTQNQLGFGMYYTPDGRLTF